MFYRTRIDLSFLTRAKALKAREKALAMLPEAFTINPDSLEEETGYIKVEKCYHDVDPSIPCEPIESHFTS